MDNTVGMILGLPEHEEGGEEKEDGKLPQSVVVYLTPDQIKNEEGAHCGGCIFFNHSRNECLLTSPSACNAEHGVCDAFLGGDSIFKNGSALKLLPKESAGYITEGPTRCGLCEYWQGEEHAKGTVTSTCAKVQGTIAASGCCNSWEEC